MSEFCIEHMWYGEQACPHCHQPSDEPCPSSCGVEAVNPAISGIAHHRFCECWEPVDIEHFAGVMHKAGLVLRTREEWEEMGKEAHEGPLKALAAHQSAELVALRDKYASVVDRLTDLHQGDTEAELATLRAQLVEKDAEFAHLRAQHESLAQRFDEIRDAEKAEYERKEAKLGEVIRSMNAELERLRKGVKDEAAEHGGGTGCDHDRNGSGASSSICGHVAIVPGVSVGALLLTTNTDHRLGQGNRLEGEPEYHEPKPVMRTRPML
jgi:hypothetical protein